MKRTAVDIVTGFLGAGKTTLLARALKGPLSRPDVVFVVNEIGEIGLDGKVLTGFAAAERVVELASGCICCSIEDARFDLAIRELVERYDPALVVIETTGLADPGPLEERVAAAGLGLDAVITVVDASALEVSARQARVVRRQIEAADFIVMTKADLCSASELARARKQVSRWNKRARVFDAVRGEVGSELLFGLAMRRYRSGETGATPAGRAHLTEDGIASVSIRSDRPLDRARFERFLKKLPSSVIRAKGIASIDGTPWRCVFNYTCGRYEMDWIEWPSGRVGTEAVFLGKNISEVESTLAEGLTRCQAE